MAELNFQTSRKTYTVNGGAEISFDPADIGFAHRLYTLMDKLKKEWEMPAPEETDVFEFSAQRDKRARQEIDKAFGSPVCDKVFGDVNIFSPAGGMPVCFNFLVAVIDEVDAASAREIKTSARTEEYLRRYQEKYGK